MVNDLDGGRFRIDHPGRNEEGPIVDPAQGQMPATSMELVAYNDHPLPEKWMKRIGYLHLPSQTPGIMRSHRTVAANAPPSSTA